MEIKDIQPNQGNVDIVAEVTEKEELRTFEKFGKTGQVCNAKLKATSGEIKLTLWNEDIEKVNLGDKIHLVNGWCSEYQGEKQVSSGKFGKIEIVESSAAKTVYTNDPNLLAEASPEDGAELEGGLEENAGEGAAEEEDAGEETDSIEEELVE